MSLWEIFQHNFPGFMEENFKSASIHHHYKLWDYLQIYDIWIRKKQSYIIIRLLYDALLAKNSTDQTELEIMACKPKEEFVSYYIKKLLDSDFGRKSQISTTRPPPVPISLVSPLSTSGLSVPVPVYTPIHPMQPLGIGSTPQTYNTLIALGTPTSSTSGIGPTYRVYIQPLRPTSTVYIQSPGKRLPSTALGIKSISATYTPLLGTGATLAVYT